MQVTKEFAKGIINGLKSAYKYCCELDPNNEKIDIQYLKVNLLNDIKYITNRINNIADDGTLEKLEEFKSLYIIDKYNKDLDELMDSELSDNVVA